MEATLTLHQAGIQLGVEDTVLSRLIRIGALPEAKKVNQENGAAWVIPTEDLSKVATRNGWTIDLRADQNPLTVTGNATAVDEAPAEQTSDSDPNSESEEPPPAGSAQDGFIDVSAESSDDTAASDEPSGQIGSSATGALVPHSDSTPAATDTSEQADGAPTMSEAIDLALLDRLLGVQEERVTAQVEAREAKHALAALNTSHDRATGELEIERRERMVVADRFREERMARAVADAKVAELRDRVVREMSLADAEKEARAEALARSIRAERDAANAVASMGWLARRRFRKLSKGTEK